MSPKNKKAAKDKEQVDNIEAQQQEVMESEEATVEQTDSVSEDLTDEKAAVESEAAEAKKTDAHEDEKNDPVVAAEEKAKEWQDKYMRLSAEFDNYRKRTLKEKMDLTKLANEDLLKNILPVVDDFERGRDTIGKAQSIEALKEGIDHIYTKFKEFLKRNGVKEIEAMNEPFDIDFHEAITKIPSPDESGKGKVLDVVEKGYLLNEKVIRYAKVVVGD